MPHGQVSRRELTNLRTYKGTVSRLVERVSKIRQVLATTHTSGTGPSLSNGSSVLCCHFKLRSAAPGKTDNRERVMVALI